jgi:hypothetical protein
MRNPRQVLVAAFFDTHKELRLEQVYCLPLFSFPTLDAGLNSPSEAQIRLFRRKDVTGLLLIEMGRKAGEFRRCGMFETQWKGLNLLKTALKDTCNDAANSGIPFEKTKNGNQFVITIV